MIELGISTFGDTTPLEKSGETLSHAQRIRNLIEEIELADQVGLDLYAVGEHHRDDFAVSAPEIILAGGAINTKNIRLSSAVTVLSSSDPIRVYQQYASIDALSHGRAEIMAGRGSFTESFPLFGYELADYEALFDEKLAMLLEIKRSTNLNWQGKHTQMVLNRPVYPRAEGDLPIWVGTGGNPESTIKIAEKGLPIAYAIIGGNPKRFRQLVDLYKEVGQHYGHSAEQLKVACHSWGWIAENHDQAVQEYFYPTKVATDNVGRDRPHWRELTYSNYLHEVGENGAMFVGNPEKVAEKIIKVVEALQLDRFMLHLPLGSMPHEQILNAIHLYGEQVAPKVRTYFNSH